MRILIVGPGALGGLLASVLTRGNDGTDSIALLDYNRSRAEKINAGGFHYEKDGQKNKFNINVFSDPRESGDVDALLLCVKSYDVEKSLQFCAPLLKSECLTIFMQNGIAHLQYADTLKNTPVAFGTTTEGATCLAPGHVYHAGTGTTYLGFQKPTDSRQATLLTRVIERFRAGGMKIELAESILTRIWAKLFINVGINALTVVHNCKNGELLNIPEAREQMALAIAEAQAVAAREGISSVSPLDDTHAVCRATARNVSSMLQDVRKERKTEIDAINGAIVSLAERHDLAVPVNTALVRQVKEIEKQYAKTSHSPGSDRF